MSSTVLLLLVIAGLVAGTYVLLGMVNKQPAYSRQSRWRKHLPLALFLGAVACLVLAFMQFRLEKTAVQGTVILTIDASNSMDREDVDPNRLEAAKDAARAFVAKLPAGFPVGVVSFANEPTVDLGPTLEREAVSAALDRLPRGRGTVIGDGLATSLDTLEADREQNGDRPSAVVLLSDGNDTGSQVAPLDAAQRAADLGIPVYTVVLGQVGGKGGADAELLGQIAQTTGATSATAGTSGQLTSVYEQLGSQLSTDLAIGGAGPLFVVLGAVFALAAGVAVLLGSRAEF
jgi:Ca-activated chloride channel family protein